MCHCGQPLHYTDPDLQKSIERIIQRLGQHVEIDVSGRKFLVCRHYIALHGLEGSKVHELGFQEITGSN
jgi:hypothetical protein